MLEKTAGAGGRRSVRPFMIRDSLKEALISPIPTCASMPPTSQVVSRVAITATPTPPTEFMTPRGEALGTAQVTLAPMNLPIVPSSDAVPNSTSTTSASLIAGFST
jgi:hypothetical protein